MADETPMSSAGGSRHERASQLLEAYVLDALEPEETALVAEHLEEGCDGCEDEVGVLRRVAGVMALATPLRETGAALRQRIFSKTVGDPPAAVQDERAERGAGRAALVRLWSWPGLGRWATVAASFGMLAVGGLLAWNIALQTQVDGLEGDSSRLEGSVLRMEDDQTETVQALGVAEARSVETLELVRTVEMRMTEALVSLSAPSTRTVSLTGTNAAPTASAQMMWEPESGVFVMIASGLRSTAGGGAYVMWVDTPDGPEKVGHFYVDESGRGMVSGYLKHSLSGGMVISVGHEDDLEIEAPSGAPVLVLAQ